jgi:peptidase C25-like protein
MAKVDKVIIGNDSALKTKYGRQFREIHSNVARLVAADKSRGLNSRYMPVDDVSLMKTLGTKPATPGDEKSHKEAVDAIYAKFQPDYMTLLGSPDIIPHITLKNPLFNPKQPDDDSDKNVPSDLPYACEMSYGDDPGDFVGPTRVVSRLPDIFNSPDSKYLLTVLKFAGKAVPRVRSDYATYLGVTADVWHRSTAKSLTNLFGAAKNMRNVPSSTYRWSSNQLDALSHFFNCHGDDVDTHYYGQHGESYPIAHEAAYITGKIQPGTVMAAECCYGAQLFDPAHTKAQMPIANVYLQDGANAFWGSTTIAYGPATTNNNADLICQYFFQEALKGSSIGESALLARQKLAGISKTISPTNLKTLAQFILLGDASVHCVASDLKVKTSMKIGSGKTAQVWNPSESQRKLRRSTAAYDGRVLSLFRRRASAESTRTDPRIEKTLLQIAAQYDIADPSIITKGIIEPHVPQMLKATPGHIAALDDVQHFHLVFDRHHPEQKFVRRILEIEESERRILSVRELFTR